MTAVVAMRATFVFICLCHEAATFSVPPPSTRRPLARHPSHHRARRHDRDDSADPSAKESDEGHRALRGRRRPPPPAHTRRAALRHGALATAAAVASATAPPRAHAVGSLPEFREANAVLQSLTVDVTDKRQYEETIAFFTQGFDGMKVLRARKGGKEGAVQETWLGFGPETFAVPPAFQLPVSALAQYGGHASLRLRYDPRATAPLYVPAYANDVNVAPAPGANVAYLQLGVTQYKISQMQANGGNIEDAYGWVNVVSPAGLPVRAIVGVSADPMMFVALNCNDVKKSEEFYAQLGFARQEYPYARLNEGQGQFEPPQPPNSVYLAPAANSMGVLLLQNQKRKKTVAPNPVLRSLNVVYAPPEGGDDDRGNGGDDAAGVAPKLADPSAVPIAFVAQEYFEQEIKKTAAAVPGS